MGPQAASLTSSPSSSSLRQTYERTLADVFAVQDELARAIAADLTHERGISVIGRVPILLSWAGNVHPRLGRREQALALLAELR